MKYLPIQINQEWCLRAENPHIFYKNDMFLSYAHIKFEQQAMSTAKPIINHDGREWYDSTDLEEVWQYWSDWEKWTNCGEPSRFKNYDEFKEYWSNGTITTKTRPVWKYIGEKPVENEIAKLVLNLDVIHDREKLIFSKVEVEELVEAERTRIIRIIEERKIFHNKILDDKKQGLIAQAFIAELDYLLTKINNNGNKNSIDAGCRKE